MKTKLRIGYFANSSDLSAAGDRRRLVFWAQQRGHLLKVNSCTNVDVVVLTGGGIYPKLQHLENIPLIIDLPDSYAVRDHVIKDYLRSVVRSAKRQKTCDFIRFSEFILDIIRRADLVVTSSVEQSQNIPFAKNVRNILDFHHEFPDLIKQKPPQAPFSFFWEGQTHSLKKVSDLRYVHRVNSEAIREICLITNKTHPLISNNIKVPTIIAFPDLFLQKSIHLDLVPWSLQNVVTTAKKSDISFIPVNRLNVISYLKPENRILISWRLGLPVIATRTPSHLRLQKNIECEFTYDTLDELNYLVDRFIQEPTLVMQQINEGKSYLARTHTSQLLLKSWDEAIESTL